jgi:radical SAM enzyme (TIGR01210 family)
VSRAAAEASRIRALRPARAALDPWRPLGLRLDRERGGGGEVEPVLTVFLAGSECPYTCVFCDLWQHTLPVPTPAGALPAQLRAVLADERVAAAAPRRIKLYNASNFFEPRAVPPSDLRALAEIVRPFPGVTVESHPRLVDEACFEFARRLAGRLEVAMGLETIHPQALPRLGKQAGLDDFARAMERLEAAAIGVRAFVLVGTPFIPAEEGIAWAVRSAAWALDHGAQVVSLIPVRGGNGELERLAAAGDFTPPTLGDLEAALEGALGLGRGVVLADLWDAPGLPACGACRAARTERLARMNASGVVEAAVACAACARAH